MKSFFIGIQPEASSARARPSSSSPYTTALTTQKVFQAARQKARSASSARQFSSPTNTGGAPKDMRVKLIQPT